MKMLRWGAVPGKVKTMLISTVAKKVVEGTEGYPNHPLPPLPPLHQVLVVQVLVQWLIVTLPLCRRRRIWKQNSHPGRWVMMMIHPLPYHTLSYFYHPLMTGTYHSTTLPPPPIRICVLAGG